jgi:phenylpropionate dioxygenase-like ring-hydroxylating dioxygenase large terminal subunit
MKFLKNYWYPIALSSEVSKTKPYSTSLLGEPIVLFRDTNGSVICLHDVCPHQGVPLSLGKVENGQIECPYHGWQFGKEGVCTKIPSLSPDAKIPKTAVCRFTYPAEEHGGTIWVFAGDRKNVTPLKLPEGFGVNGWKHTTVVKESDVSHHFLVSGTLDFAHIAFTHRASLGKDRKMVDRPIVDIETIDYEHGLRAGLKNSDLVLTFEPPCLVQIAVEPGPPGWRLLLNEYPVPLTENKTRMFMFICRNWLTWNPLVTLALQQKTHRILNEDSVVVRGQHERHKTGDIDRWCAVRPDVLAMRYRQWYESQSRNFTKDLQLETQLNYDTKLNCTNEY